MADPMLIFAAEEPDPNSVFDFDTMTLDKKKVFIEKVFAGERILIDMLFSGSFADHFFTYVFEKVYREKRTDMINGLNGKMTFNEFKSYYASFFK